MNDANPFSEIERRRSSVPVDSPFSAEPSTEMVSSSFHLDVGQLTRRYILLALLLTILGAGLGFLSVALISPAYKSAAVIEVQPISTGLLKLQGAGDEENQISLLTEAEILKSNTFLRNVIQRLQTDSFSSPPPQTDIFSKLRHLLKTDSPVDSVKIGPTDVTPETAPKYLSMAIRSLDIRPLQGTHILQITCDSTNAEFAAQFINALIDEYVQHNYQERMDSVRTTTQWIAGQLEDTKTKMVETERRLQEFMQNSAGRFASQEDTLTQAKLRDLQGRLAAAQSDLIAKRALFETIEKSTPDALPNVIDDASVRQYQARIADLRREEATLTTTLTPEHPKVKRIEAQINDLKATQQKELSNAIKRITSQYDQAKRDEELLKRAYTEASEQVVSQTTKESQYNELKKEAEAAREAYNNVLLQANQASMAGSLPVNNIQIIDRATAPTKPYKPKPIMNVGLGGFVGLGLCCGVAFLREKLDQRVSTPIQARQLLDLPQLGVIPSLAQNNHRFLLPSKDGQLPDGEYAISVPSSKRGAQSEINVHAFKNELLAESFRLTLASLLRESRHARSKVILVTSPGPSEGKTTIASNLATALAETGRRVLLLDADFRRPAAHKMFGIENRSGVVDLLAEDTPLADYPRRAIGLQTSVPNLFLLPNGTASPNIPKTLYSTRLPQLIQRARQDFDTVLIDAPPLLPVADARILSVMTDGVVLVLRSQVTDKESAAEALDRLRSDGAPILGTVLNDWKPTKSQEKRQYYYNSLD